MVTVGPRLGTVAGTEDGENGETLTIPNSCNIEVTNGAVNSAGECYLHTVEVAGSNPALPTRNDKGLQLRGAVSPFLLGIPDRVAL